MQISIIFLKEPQAMNGILAFLNLIKKKKCLARNYRYSIKVKQLIRDISHITILLEYLCHFGISLKVYFQEIPKSLTQMTNGT